MNFNLVEALAVMMIIFIIIVMMMLLVMKMVMLMMMTVILNKALALVGPLRISLCRAKNIYGYVSRDDHHGQGFGVVDDNKRV